MTFLSCDRMQDSKREWKSRLLIAFAQINSDGRKYTWKMHLMVHLPVYPRILRQSRLISLFSNRNPISQREYNFVRYTIKVEYWIPCDIRSHMKVAKRHQKCFIFCFLLFSFLLYRWRCQLCCKRLNNVPLFLPIHIARQSEIRCLRILVVDGRRWSGVDKTMTMCQLRKIPQSKCRRHNNQIATTKRWLSSLLSPV